jgi:hypothetical protein
VLTVSLLAANGKACMNAPPLEVALLQADDRALKPVAPVDNADNAAGGPCPMLAAQMLDPGAYFVRVRSLKPADAFAYRIEFAWSAPPEPEPEEPMP